MSYTYYIYYNLKDALSAFDNVFILESSQKAYKHGEAKLGSLLV